MKRTPLVRKTPLARGHVGLARTRIKPKPVERGPDWGVERSLAINRDGGCVAALYFGQTDCADQWGEPMDPRELLKLEVDHVGEQRMGKRAPDHHEFLVSGCPGHHKGSGRTRAWFTAHREELREYLDRHHPGRHHRV